MRFILISLLLILLTSCQTNDKTIRTIDMYNASGDMVGTAKLREEPDGVQVKLKVEGLSPGFHGIHVHEYPKCEGPDFKSAGNHFNPEGKEHGFMHPKGAHLGDLPNVEAESDGLAKGELMVDSATLLDGKKSLLKGEGTSIIINKGKDDGMTQPGGDSGERIICGEIKTDTKESTKSPTDPTETDKKEE